MTTPRTLVVGDVHGCLAELDDLLRLVEYRPDADRLLFTGDLVDRGPDSAGGVRRVRELRAECVRGNHEDWYLRWARREAERAAGGQNRMQPRPRKEAILAELREDDLAWVAGLPVFIHLPHFTLVHAGFEPNLSIDNQDPSVCMRMRYLRRSSGKMLSLDEGELLLPTVAAFWTELWPGPQSVVYGHHPTLDRTPAVDEPRPGVFCWGIDTGCCFGGTLTALVEAGGHVSFAQVAAREVYAARRGACT